MLQLLELFPDADIYTSVYDPELCPEAIRRARVHTSFLDRLPGAKRYYPRLLPLMNTAFESFDLDGYDLVLSSNHACAKNVITAPGTLHVCYCHTPMRYAWDPGFMVGERLGRAERVLLPFLLSRLRRMDVIASARPDVYVANSRHVAERIRKYYRRDSHVIHPARGRRAPARPTPRGRRVLPVPGSARPVQASRPRGGRVRPARPAEQGRGRRAGRGRAGGRGRPRRRVPAPSGRQHLPGVLAGARALLFPGEEDFGIVLVEAQAAGVPVIAYGRGGARDSVKDGVTGVLYDDPGVEGLGAAIERFETLSFDDGELRRGAAAFARERFRSEMADLLTAVGSEVRE